MRVVVRLYRRFDYDLLSLRMTEGFSLNELFKAVLVAYAKGEAFSIRIPDNVERNISDDITSMRVDFSLKESNPDHKNAINLLLSVRNKKRNDFLKALLRGYLSGPVVSAYIEDAELDGHVLSMEHGFNRASKKVVDIKSESKKNSRVPVTALEKEVAAIFNNVEATGEVSFKPVVADEIVDITRKEIAESDSRETLEDAASTKESTSNRSIRFNINKNAVAQVEDSKKEVEAQEDEDFDILSSIEDMMSSF